MRNDIVWIGLGLWNICVFLLYGWDKRRAKSERYRVSEKMLLLSALLFGALGALLGMHQFHHKTMKPVFRFLIPIFLILQIGVIYYCLRG